MITETAISISTRGHFRILKSGHFNFLLTWVMDRQCIKTDKASGIASDANRYAIETVGDPRYPLNLFLRVITVSLKTMRIMRALPGSEIK